MIVQSPWPTFKKCMRNIVPPGPDRHLEVDILGEALDETPALRQRRAAGEGGRCAGMIDRRAYGERTDDMPVLFDQPLVDRKCTRDLLNEPPVKHAQNSGRSRYSRSDAAHAF